MERTIAKESLYTFNLPSQNRRGHIKRQTRKDLKVIPINRRPNAVYTEIKVKPRGTFSLFKGPNNWNGAQTDTRHFIMKAELSPVVKNNPNSATFPLDFSDPEFRRAACVLHSYDSYESIVRIDNL